MTSAKSLIGRIVCRWKGSHRWSKAKPPVAYPSSSERYKHCLRCGLEREVKKRVKR
jgi:hypothetical protein